MKITFKKRTQAEHAACNISEKKEDFRHVFHDDTTDPAAGFYHVATDEEADTFFFGLTPLISFYCGYPE